MALLAPAEAGALVDMGPVLQRWAATYPVQLGAAVLSPDGSRLYMFGRETEWPYKPTGIWAVDARTGTELWSMGTGGMVISSISVSPDGSLLYVAGARGDGYALIALDIASRTQVWSTTYDGAYASGMALSPGGDYVYLTGSDTDPYSRSEFVTVAFRAATGERIWVTRHSRESAGNNYGTSVYVSPDGATLYVTGTSSDGVQWKFTIVAYESSSGTQRWLTQTSGFPWGPAVVANDGSRLFVTSNVPTATGTSAATTLAYDTLTGAEIWRSRVSLPTEFSDTRSYGIAASPDDTRVFISGTLNSSEYMTVAYDAATGRQSWLSTYPGIATGGIHGFGAGIAVSPDGRSVFMTGNDSFPGGDPRDRQRMATVAYEAASGTRRWVARYSDPSAGSSDGGGGIHLSPDGTRLYVLGGSTSGAQGSSPRFLVVAYCNLDLPARACLNPEG